MPSEQQAGTAVSAGQPQGSRRRERVQTGILGGAIGALLLVAYAAYALLLVQLIDLAATVATVGAVAAAVLVAGVTASWAVAAAVGGGDR